MFRSVLILFLFCSMYSLLQGQTSVMENVNDCIWGGKNQETSYSPAYLPGTGNVTLVQYQHPAMNLGAPQPGISPTHPIQPIPHSPPASVPQTQIPMITIPVGPVGSVGRPATSPIPHNGLQHQTTAEIAFILPSAQPANAMVCIDGQKMIPATEAKLVPSHTPGAVPVMLQTVLVQRPKVDYHWTYGPIVNTTETLVQVVDPRSGRVVKSYCHEDTHRSTLPWLHRREVTSYETVEAKVAVPLSSHQLGDTLLAPAHSSAVNTLIHGGLP